jgi:hypothetical protein
MMGTESQTEIALHMYLRRGEDALQALEKGDYAEAIELLKWRNAAFQSLRVVEYAANQLGKSIYQDPTFQESWQRIQFVNQTLEEAIQESLTALGQALEKSIRVRQRIAKFRSGHTFSEHLVDII